MKTFLTVLGALALLLVAFGLWAMGSYNGLVGRSEHVGKVWADVESQYQRRLDLIPNLVETVKGSAKFERETLSAVVEARSKVGQMNLPPNVLEDPETFRRFEQAQGALSSALSRLMVVVERYPDLKASQGFRDLQVQLEGTENRIAVARRDFNEAARDYNTAIKVFPGRVVAAFAGFKERPYFAAAPEASRAPSVKF